MAISPTEIRNWTIYKITNPSGKIYIGITTNILSRIGHYRNYQRGGNQAVLYSSLKKYGYPAHKVEILETFESNKDYAFGKEIFWIRSFMSNVNKWGTEYGLNLTDGGEGTPGQKHTPSQNKALRDRMVNFKHTEESKKKISESKTGISNYKLLGRKLPLTDEERKIRSERLKGKKLFLGRKHTIESRMAMSFALSGRKINPESIKKSKDTHTERYGKKILQYDTNGNFIQEHSSKRELCRELGISRTCLKNILNGTTKEPFYHVFKYKL